MDRVQADVCIVGGGFAGLAAAHKLHQAGKSVAVLEARDRVGGKVFTHVLPDGTRINMGGTWLGEGHTRIYALARELGLETYRQHVQGDSIIIIDGKVVRYAGTIARVNPVALIDVGLAIKMLDWMASQVPLDAPWEAEKAREWDSTTIGAWIDSRWHATTDIAQKMLRVIFTEMHMSDPAEVSLLHALHFIHSCRSIEWVASTIGGAQQDHVVGGTHGIAERMAAKLGDAVRLRSPVRRVTGEAVWLEGGEPHPFRRDGLGGRAVEPGRHAGALGTGGADGLRPGAARAVRAHSLGRDRDGDPVAWQHRGSGPLRRAGR
jgi:monoamine oxidase